MIVENLFNGYRNLDFKEKLNFDKLFFEYKNKQKKEIVETFRNILKENDEPYFSVALNTVLPIGDVN